MLGSAKPKGTPHRPASLLTATSTVHSIWLRNLAPILAQILSSSTSRTLGGLSPHGEPPASLGGGVSCAGSAMALGLLGGRV